MMDVHDTGRYGRTGTGRIRVSFELFPPKDEVGADAFWRTVKRLEPLAPDFVSVTYGAGGTTRERTLGALSRIGRETGLRTAGHLTCVGAAKPDVDDVIRSYHAAGVRHIVALRGDPPAGPGSRYQPHPGGYRNAADLVAGIRRIARDVTISVAAYPECHPDSGSIAADLDNLKAKAEAGADQGIAQFFFENADFLRLRDRAAAHGIRIPIIPGIVPIHNFKQVAGFAGRCGAKVPAWLAERFEGLDEDPETSRLVGVAVAAEQVLDLIEQGIDRFHFYTLNRPELTYAMCRLIGLKPVVASVAEVGGGIADGQTARRIA